MTELALGTEAERAELIAICEAAVVPESDWHDRDSQGAQVGVGKAWVLLRAGCDFHIHGAVAYPNSDKVTIWLTIWSKGFAVFDHDGDRVKDTIYLPTRARLERAGGKDWY